MSKHFVPPACGCCSKPLSAPRKQSVGADTHVCGSNVCAASVVLAPSASTTSPKAAAIEAGPHLPAHPRRCLRQTCAGLLHLLVLQHHVLLHLLVLQHHVLSTLLPSRQVAAAAAPLARHLAARPRWAVLPLPLPLLLLPAYRLRHTQIPWRLKLMTGLPVGLSSAAQFIVYTKRMHAGGSAWGGLQPSSPIRATPLCCKSRQHAA